MSQIVLRTLSSPAWCVMSNALLTSFTWKADCLSGVVIASLWSVEECTRSKLWVSATLWTHFWCHIILVVRRLSESQIWDLLLKHLVISKIVPEILISKSELLKPAHNLTTNFATTHLTNFFSFLLDFPVGYFKIHSPSISWTLFLRHPSCMSRLQSTTEVPLVTTLHDPMNNVVHWHVNNLSFLRTSPLLGPNNRLSTSFSNTCRITFSNYYYYYYYLLHLSLYSVAVALTLATNKNIHKRNNTKHSTNNIKHSKYKYTSHL